jgi:proline iminopeptidase
LRLTDLDVFVEGASPDKPVSIVGHSWGAMLASVHIGRYSEKVGKAVLAEPGFLDHEHMEIW